MRTLAKHPPEGWTASLLPSHANRTLGMVFAAWKAARALRALPSDASTVVHLHAASDWSLRRKLRLAARCRRPVVLHLHSGDTARWLQANAGRASRVRAAIEAHVTVVVVLDEAWKTLLEPLVGKVEVVPNPVHPLHNLHDAVRRDGTRLLVMGRDAPVKRRDFAVDVVAHVRKKHPEVHLHMTGGQPMEGDGWTRHGWLTDAERLTLLQATDVLLLPSRFEGQPLAALEALACGVSVVAAGGLVGLPDTVVRPPSDSVAAWAEAIESTLRAPSEPSALAASVSHHAVQHVAQDWAGLYAMAQQRSEA
jgi:glycosyltransferase involved in cell wall biosynthesis